MHVRAYTGVQVGVLRAFNLPAAGLGFGLVSLAPPAHFYAEPPQPSGLRYTDAVDWESNLRSPVWKAGAFLFPQVALTERALFVFDVRCLTKLGDASSLRSQGWAVLPVFFDGGVNSGVHQLPLYAGEPTAELLLAMGDKGHEEVIKLELSKKRLKHVEGASLVVSLLDAQRLGEWDRADLRPDPPDRSHLPPKKLKQCARTASGRVEPRPGESSRCGSHLVFSLLVLWERGRGGGSGETCGLQWPSASPHRGGAACRSGRRTHGRS